MRRLLSLALFVLGCNAVGGAGALLTLDQTRPFYAALQKPPLAPPPSIFGPVWTLLYTLMGVAAWRVWQASPTPERRRALVLFAVQLALNALWSPVFFGLQSPPLALAVIVAMLAAVAATLWAFWRVDRVAAGLLVPYLLWVGFATYLNAGVVALNG